MAAGIQSGKVEVTATPTSLKELIEAQGIDLSGDSSTEMVILWRVSTEPVVAYGDSTVEFGATPATDPLESGTPLVADTLTFLPIERLENLYLVAATSVPPASVSYTRLH